MVYTSTGGSKKFNAGPYDFGYATSPDGLQWTKGVDNPILSSLNHPAWGGVYLVSLVRQAGTWFLYFDIAGSSGTGISLYTYSGEFGP